MGKNNQVLKRGLITFSLGSIGDGLNFTILPMIALSLFKTPEAVALIITARTLPGLILSIPAGLISDMFDRRSMIAITNTMRSVVMLILAVFFLAEIDIPFYLMLLFAFLIGAFETTYEHMFLSGIPFIFPKSELVKVNTLFKSSEMVCGLLLGGMIGAIFFLFL